jgi:hypothetical protein
MSLSYPTRAYINGPALTLDSTGIPSGATTFKVSSSPVVNDVVTGATVVNTKWFAVTVDYGTSFAEKIYCTFDASSNTFTIKQRNVDGTTVTSHAGGANLVFTWTATEAAETQAAVQAMKTILTNAGTATAPVSVVPGATASAGSANIPAPMDHVHSLANSDLNTWLQGSASGAVASGVTVPVASLTGTLTTAQLANASSAWAAYITSGSIPSGSTFPSTPQISQSVTGFPSYLITFTCTAKNLDTTAGHNVLAEIGFGAGSTAGSATQISATTNTVSGAVGGTNTGFSALTCTYVIGSQTPATTYTAGGYVTIGGSTAGSIVNATLSIVGLA